MGSPPATSADGAVYDVSRCPARCLFITAESTTSGIDYLARFPNRPSVHHPRIFMTGWSGNVLNTWQ